MAYPHNFIKVTFGGRIYNDQDIWSNGINFGLESANVDFSESELQGAAEACAGDISTWFKAGATSISQRATLDWVKVALIGQDGKYVFDADIYDLPAPVAGASSANAPAQNTVAMTMETSRRRVPGRFARIFPPLNVPTIGNDGRVNLGTAGGMRDTFVTLLNELNDQLSVLSGDPVRAIVASEKTDKHYSVKTVKVGNVVDTQRSRRNAMKEVYTTPAVLIGAPAPSTEPPAE